MKFSEGLLPVLQLVADGNENEKNKEPFEKKVDELFKDEEVQQVQGFDPNNKEAHLKTLREMRSLYCIEWASYVLTKLSEPTA